MSVFYKKATDLEKDVQKLFNLLKWEEIINEGDGVLIKPNFCADYRDGITTNMELLEAIVNLAAQRTENVVVGETESSYKDNRRMVEDFPLDCEFLNLSKEETFTHKGLNLPKIALESVIINVPVFKTHVLTSMTLGIKNLFGFIQDKSKSQYHHKIDATLQKILEVIKPQINVLDGIYTMDGSGPTDGRIMRTDFLMASRDVVALDMAACSVAGIDPSQVNHIWQASQKYGVQPEILTDFQIDFEVPRVRRTARYSAYLQENPVTRRLLENPGINSIARKVKRTLDGPNASKKL